MKPVVFVCQPFLFQRPGAYRQVLESAGFEVRYPRDGGKVLSEMQLAQEVGDVEATIASTEPYTESILQRASRLRIVSRTGVGYDSIDVAAATSRNIAVGFTPGANHDAVAEHVFAMMLGVAKQLIPNHMDIIQGGFSRQPTRALRGRLLGLIGLGRIGTAVARRAIAFGMSVIACDPFVTKPLDEISTVGLVSLPELLAQADIISLHAAHSEANRGLINVETLRQMKPGVVLINTARGTLVDEGALSDALRSGKVAAAALDVFAHEPPAASPLLSAPNIVLSPHIAGVDDRTLEDTATMAAQTIVDLFQGRWPTDRVVNAAQLPQPWRWDGDQG